MLARSVSAGSPFAGSETEAKAETDWVNSDPAVVCVVSVLLSDTELLENSFPYHAVESLSSAVVLAAVQENHEAVDTEDLRLLAAELLSLAEPLPGAITLTG